MNYPKCKDGGLCGLGGFCDECPLLKEPAMSEPTIDELLSAWRSPNLDACHPPAWLFRSTIAALERLKKIDQHVQDADENGGNYVHIEYLRGQP